MTCATQVIGPVLIRDEQQKVGTIHLWHQSALMLSSLASWL
jgi:hypothetical protein